MTNTLIIVLLTEIDMETTKLCKSTIIFVLDIGLNDKLTTIVIEFFIK